MNGDTGRPFSNQGQLAPAYSLLRDVENSRTAPNQPAVGRYTAISKSVTKGGGISGQWKGSYQPASHCSILEQSRRSAFKQTGSAVSHPIGTSIGTSSGAQCAKPQQQQAWSTTRVNGYSSNDNFHNGHQASGLVNGGHSTSEAIGRAPVRAYESTGGRAQSVTSSTLILRDCSREPTAGVGLQSNNRSVGGSLSCGQPSPSSTGGDASVSCLSPTGSVRGAQVCCLNGQQPHYQPHLFGQPDSLWLHQSELHLPIGKDAAGKYWDEAGGSDYCSSTTPRRLNAEFDVPHQDKGQRSDIAVGTEFHQAPPAKHYGSYNFSGDLLAPNSQCYSNSSIMLYGSRNPPDDHLNSISMGPSSRKIQTLHGMGNNQRRFPSDTNLHYTPKEKQQVYTSGSKPGPVTIPAKSRSAQPSPGPSPCVSPTSLYRASETNLNQDYSLGTGRSRGFRPQQFQDVNYIPTPGRRGSSSPPSSVKYKNMAEDGSESPILPSVKEIIRQVEAMTQANAATSTTDISVLGQSGSGATGIPRFQRQLAGRKSLPSTESGFSRPGAPYRQSGSQRTPSAPQLRQYTPIQAKFNATVSTSRQSAAPPVPPHGASQSKTVIGSFTRRMEPNSLEGSQRQRSEVCINPPNQKKIELLSQLPMDYQKLREAFIEQRREIQRLRKQLAEKDLLINQLQNDIRLYEPWR